MKIKFVINSIIIRISKLAVIIRMNFQESLGILKNYQPDAFNTNDISKSLRSCYDRLQKIESILPQEKAKMSFMDIGCHTGFFLFKLVNKKSGFGIGIDHGVSEVMIASAKAEKYGIKNISFLNYELDDQNIDSLPNVDVVIFLSVFHHFVRYFKEDKAIRMLEKIAEKAGRFFIFETGQPNEDSDWAQELKFMSNDSDQWVLNKFKNLGFDRVLNCGQFDTSVSDKKRTLFIAERFSK